MRAHFSDQQKTHLRGVWRTIPFRVDPCQQWDALFTPTGGWGRENHRHPAIRLIRCAPCAQENVVAPIDLNFLIGSGGRDHDVPA